MTNDDCNVAVHFVGSHLMIPIISHFAILPHETPVTMKSIGVHAPYIYLPNFLHFEFETRDSVHTPGGLRFTYGCSDGPCIQIYGFVLNLPDHHEEIFLIVGEIAAIWYVAVLSGI
ncbi:uncharacterized protein EDB93DRAFT_1154045 [Suillus bovinus]|uniref:uncharacterized protein n=1 Tax=Suillus bovinus TaxID=48563 RepID=UPI001B8867BD|nr:uncharacterized protein EDB93DRAFT_1154045 [Suillus bovinus]KAG2144152.1 hypothetical protein EDB93DRAFT_1154045 [Suillus bovinus]